GRSASRGAGPAAIRERVAPQARIEIAIEDGCRLAANVVGLGKTLVMSGCGRRLRAELTERGYDVVTTPLPSFLRSGGLAFFLTLRLDRRPVPTAAMAHNVAAAGRCDRGVKSSTYNRGEFDLSFLPLKP